MSERQGIRPKLPTDLKRWKYEIERLARKLGLSFNETIFEIIDYEEMQELAAYSGYPIRYHHWTFGQESIRLKKSYRWGLHIIFEMVVPTGPCYAYLLEANSKTIQKAVMAHVYGHNDFFSNNIWFKNIPKNIHQKFADNAVTLEKIRAEIGKEKVDTFLEACMSLDNLLDPLSTLIKRAHRPELAREKAKEKRHPKRVEPKQKLPSYMDDYLNPPEVLEKKREKIRKEEELLSEIARGIKIPERPLPNVLEFILQWAPLEKWQQEIVRIVWEENYYLWLGAQTKIMNEGWAAFWEAEIMAGQGVALDPEVCSFALTHARVVKPGVGDINPYRLGRELWEYIKFAWDTCRHGRIWEECDDLKIKERWDEFIVFKKIFEKYGSLSRDCLKEWSEFTTWIRETEEDRGVIPAAFFRRKHWVLEWLQLKEAEKKLKQFSKLLEALREAENNINSELDKLIREGGRGEENIDEAIFEVRHKLLGMGTAIPWTLREVEEEIRKYQARIDFKQKFQNGKVKEHLVPIPENWIKFAQEHPEEIELGKGLEKIFEVRESYNDVSFIQDFFTEEFCREHQYYTIGIGKVPPYRWWGEDRYLIKSRDYLRVKKLLLSGLVNLGQPRVEIVDANYNNNRELYILHLHDGRDLDIEDLKKVLERLYLVWGINKPVHLETIVTQWPKKQPPWYYWRPPGYPKPEPAKPTRIRMLYSYDGQAYQQKELGKVE